MSEISLDGLDEFQELLKDMTISKTDERKALKETLDIFGHSLESNTPKKTGKLAEIKMKITDTTLGMEGTLQGGAFWDIFQNFGTSYQKDNLGYFDRSIDENVDEALEKLKNSVFSKIK